MEDPANISAYLEFWQMRTSLTACAHALKAVRPHLTQEKFFLILGVKPTPTAVNCYFKGRHIDAMWRKRLETEKASASAVVNHVLLSIGE